MSDMSGFFRILGSKRCCILDTLPPFCGPTEIQRNSSQLLQAFIGHHSGKVALAASSLATSFVGVVARTVLMGLCGALDTKAAQVITTTRMLCPNRTCITHACIHHHDTASQLSAFLAALHCNSCYHRRAFDARRCLMMYMLCALLLALNKTLPCTATRRLTGQATT